MNFIPMSNTQQAAEPGEANFVLRFACNPPHHVCGYYICRWAGGVDGSGDLCRFPEDAKHFPNYWMAAAYRDEHMSGCPVEIETYDSIPF